jgi:hypothetical protein
LEYDQLVRLGKVTAFFRFLGAAAGLIVVSVLFVMDRTWLLTPSTSAELNDLRLSIRWILPAVLGSLIIICATIGELLMFNHARQPGFASTEQRRITTWLSWPIIIGIVVAFGAFGFLATTLLTLTHPSRRGLRLDFYLDGRHTMTVSWPAFPDWHAAIPLILATIVALICAITGILVVARRPRNGADPLVAAWDDILRRRSLRGLGATFLAVLAANVAIVGSTLARQAPHNLVDCDGKGMAGCGVPHPDIGWYASPQAAPLLWAVSITGLVLALFSAGIVVRDTIPVRKPNLADLPKVSQ